MEKNRERKILIEYLYLDLATCDRCVGTDQVLEQVIAEMRPLLREAGYAVGYRKKMMATAEDAVKHRFLSSPTIRVNGADICDSVLENDCGCCGDISGTQVNCRIFEYDGECYEVPPKAMLIEAILKKAFGPRKKSGSVPYKLPENLKRFYKGKAAKSSCCIGGKCCSDQK